MKDLTEKRKRAASWLEGRKWKLDDSRSQLAAGYEELTLALNRTDDACPRDMLCAVVRQIEAAEYGVAQEALEVEGAVFEGTWQLKRVDWRRRDDGRNPPQDHELYLYKTYVRVTDRNPAAHVMENNCWWVVTHEWRHNMAALEDVPAGSSGITYAIRGAGQDKETRLWDYLVEKREQLTTTTGIITVEDDAFKTVYQQGWYGVRAGNKKHTGEAAGLWDPAGQAAGSTVTTPFVQKNENCTTDIIQRMTVAKAVAGAKSSAEKTLFETTAEKTDVNQAAPVAAAVEAAAGKVTRRWADKNPDGKYDNHERTVQERKVEGARRKVSRDAFEEAVENEDRGLALPGDEEEAAPYGETLEVANERTAGAWWNVVKRRVRAFFVPDAVVTVTRDAFQEVTEISRLAADGPLGAPPAAGGGVWRRWTDRRRRDQRYDQEAAETQERQIAAAAREHAAGALESSETVESVAATALAAFTEAAAGTVETRKSELTRGGFWRRRKTVVTERDISRQYKAAQDYFGSSQAETGVADAVTLEIGAGQSGRANASITPGGKLRYSKEVETAAAAMRWVLVDKASVYTLGDLGGRTADAVLVVMYANSELATAQADAEAFVGRYKPFYVITGTMTDIYHYFHYQHQIGFALHVNKNGKWDGTLTLRATLTGGMQATVGS